MGTNSITKIDNLLPYYNVAKDLAEQSPCVRKKFGAVVAYAGNDFRWVGAFNERLSECCSGSICIRDHRSYRNGENVEEGAEIHAEMAALISSGPKVDGAHFILAGLHGDKELFGPAAYSCHVCALALRYAGYKNIYLMTEKGVLSPVSVARMIKHREEEWKTEV